MFNSFSWIPINKESLRIAIVSVRSVYLLINWVKNSFQNNYLSRREYHKFYWTWQSYRVFSVSFIYYFGASLQLYTCVNIRVCTIVYPPWHDFHADNCVYIYSEVLFQRLHLFLKMMPLNTFAVQRTPIELNHNVIKVLFHSHFLA